MLNECAAWDSLLGLPLDTALEKVRTWGLDAPAVLTACAPRRKFDPADAPQTGTLRVIRARAGELTVSRFQDGDPKMI